MKFLIVFIIIALSCTANDTIKIDDHFSHALSIEKQLIFEENQEALDVYDILKYTDSGIKKTTTPSTKTVHWLSFKLYNASSKPEQILLRHPRAGLDLIDLYLFQGSQFLQKSELGDLRSHDNRTIIHRNSVEILTLQPYTTYTVISRLQSYGPYELWWSIESTNYFSFYSSLKTAVWGFLGGILIALTIYNFVLYFSFHQIAYLIYCSYAVSLLLFHYTYQGLFYQYFSQINLPLLTIGSWVWPYLTLFFLFLFPYYFFKLKGEWIGTSLLIFAGFSLACTIFYLCAIFNMNLLYITRYVTPISLVATFYLIIFCVLILIQKRPGSLYFSIARITFTICAIYDTLLVGGYLKEESFSWLVLPFGIIVDLVFLSLALGKKVKMIQKQYKSNEELLIAQSRFIAIGQTVGNITHQWKTPIVQLASHFMFLHATFIHRKDIFLKEFEKKIPQVLESMEYIQESINLFSNFYKHSNEKTHFNPLNEMQIIQKMLETKLMLNFIDMRIQTNITSIYTHKNALMNIVMILCENAIEALVSNQPEDRMIEIFFSQKDATVVEIMIQDNAGKMDDMQFGQLFTLSRSTKKDNFGLGLSIVKTLVEKKLEGEILAINSDKGLLFKIMIMCSKD